MVKKDKFDIGDNLKTIAKGGANERSLVENIACFTGFNGFAPID